MAGTVPKELRPLVKRAKKAGWTVSQTNKNHLMLESPEGERVFCAGTTASRRAVPRLRADLRRAGCPI